MALLAANRNVRFDVALVREHCQRLIAEADALDMQREVFADWTRARGMGPENCEPGAFKAFRYWPCVTCEHDEWSTCERCDPLDVYGSRCRGGWPGKLARDYAVFQRTKRRCPRRACDNGRIGECDDCLGHGFLTQYVGQSSPVGVEVPGPGFADGVRTECSSCSGTGRKRCQECNPIKPIGYRVKPSSRAFATGGNLRRAAQRLLDTLDGRCPWNAEARQPGKCTRCKDKRYHRDKTSQSRSRKCADCSGTGHNLRGVLPPLPEETQRRLAPHHRTEVSVAGGTDSDVAHAIETMVQRVADSARVPATLFYGRHQSGNDNP